MAQTSLPNRVDIAIVGGGLSGSLLAWRLRERHPDISIALIERGETLGGNHTWSFHETDLPPDLLDWIRPLIVYRWPGQEVRFPAYRRRLDTAYCTVTSERLHEHLGPHLSGSLFTGEETAAVSADAVTFEGGRTLTAGAVVDARGQGNYSDLVLGFQKFFGRVYAFEEPHGLDVPIIMDATIDQIDGYRFIYVLPFTDRTALIEDTYYADGPALDIKASEARIEEYAASQGWRIAERQRTEEGVLPIAMGGDIDAQLSQGEAGIAPIGLRAGLFHPLTGYSLPDAASTADRIASLDDPRTANLSRITRDGARDTWNDRGFYRLLSRLLFDAADPDRRYSVMQRFYKLNGTLIERLYAGRSTPGDKFRTLAGKPPVNFFRALKCVDEEAWRSRIAAKSA